MSEPEVIPLRGNAEVDPKPQPGFFRRWRWPLIVGGPLAIAAVVTYFVLTGGRTQTTDNAYVQIAKVPVAPSIAARVTERCFYQLEAPVLRVGGFAIPYPPARMEDHYLPDLDRILDAVDRTFDF